MPIHTAGYGVGYDVAVLDSLPGHVTHRARLRRAMAIMRENVVLPD